MRGEPEVIGPKWTIQLGDLSECHRIEVRCFRCNRVGVLYPDRLRKLAHQAAQAEAPVGAVIRRPLARDG